MATYWENSCSFGLRNVLWYKYLIVSLVFSHLGFWSGNLSLIAPFPDLCLLETFSDIYEIKRIAAPLIILGFERDFMDSLSHDSQVDVIETFNSTSRYLDDLLNIDTPYFEGMVNQIYPPGLQLNKANTTDTEAPFLHLHLSIADGFISSKIYDKRDDFDVDIVNFAFLDGDVPRRASYGVYISQVIRFARVCNHVANFNARNICLTAKLFQQGYRYHNLRKTFSKFYCRHYDMISKFNVRLKTLLREGLSEPEFYGDLVYKFKKLTGRNDFSFQLRKIITRYRRLHA